MKQCKKCNAMVENTASFCTSCGSSEFIDEIGATTVLDQSMLNDYPSTDEKKQDAKFQTVTQPENFQQSYNQQGTYQQGVYSQGVYQQPQGAYQGIASNQLYAQQKKKGLKWWHIVLIILGLLAFLVGMAFLIGRVSGKSGLPFVREIYEERILGESNYRLSKKEKEKYAEIAEEIENQYGITKEQIVDSIESWVTQLETLSKDELELYKENDEMVATWISASEDSGEFVEIFQDEAICKLTEDGFEFKVPIQMTEKVLIVELTYEAESGAVEVLFKND